MPKLAGRILKANDIKLEGQFHLDVVQPRAGLQKNNSAILSTPQVRITETQSDFAVIEVTCCCGSKTYVRCDYATSSASEKPANVN